MTRKVVYAEIRKLFEENGIRFAHQRVTVHVAEDDTQSDDNNTAAAAAAVGATQPSPGPAQGR